MDDRELETRLRERLHRRFDGAEPPASLRAPLEDLVPSHVRGVPRSVSYAWLAVASLVVVVVAGLGLSGWRGPGGPPPTATPAPTASPDFANRQYILLPPAGPVPSKASALAATDTLSLRLRTIGVDNFSSAGGEAITFDLLPGVDDALARSVLGAFGELSLVPLPAKDYGDGKAVAVVGQRLPVAEPALAGPDDIASAGVSTAAGTPRTVHIELKPAAAAALAEYTGQHLGEVFAVLVDDLVASLPVILEPIGERRIEIGGPESPGLLFLSAVVTSGTLPEEWRGAILPTTISEAEARDRALAAAGGTGTGSAELTTYGPPASEAGLTAAWAIVVNGSFPSVSCGGVLPSGVTPGPCPVADTELVILDAVSGAFLEGQVPAP